MELVQITTPNNWWQRFSATWLERIDVQGPLMRHRSMVLEEILRSGFEVGEPVPAWIPPSLYQRSAGAFRRLATAQRFRDTRTMVGALAREHSAMPAADRAKILEAHVELDRVYTRLEELIGIGESRGMLGDDLRRLRQADEARASVAGMQKMNIYTKHRPTMRTLIDQGIEAMNTIAGHYSRNKTLLKKMLRSGVLRIDLGSDEVTPTEILELVTDGYIKLAQALRSLVALEHELTKGLQSAAEEEEETTAVDEAG